MSQYYSADSSEGGTVESSDEPAAQFAANADVASLYMEPVQRSHVIYPAPPGWIYWMTWGTLRAGDGRMEGAKLYLYPDAMIFFQASTISSSSGDVWLIKKIQFLDQFGHPVGHPLPQHNGMNMAWAGSEYPIIFWDAIPGVNAWGAAQIRSATMTFHC